MRRRRSIDALPADEAMALIEAELIHGIEMTRYRNRQTAEADREGAALDTAFEDEPWTDEDGHAVGTRSGYPMRFTRDGRKRIWR